MSQQQQPLELGSREFWERLAGDPKQLAAEVCRIDLVNLEQTLAHQPALRAWLAAAYEAARTEEGRAESRVAKARARAILKAKEAKDPHTDKAKTGEVLKAEAEVDADVQAAEEMLFQAQDKCGALRAMNTALDDRKQMLIQISANQRKEREDYNS